MAAAQSVHTETREIRNPAGRYTRPHLTDKDNVREGASHIRVTSNTVARRPSTTSKITIQLNTQARTGSKEV
jgi:hypothetical protein